MFVCLACIYMHTYTQTYTFLCTYNIFVICYRGGTNWESQIKGLVFAHNITIDPATELSPFQVISTEHYLF